MPNYIEPHDLAEMILEGSEKFLIIDVRDDDYEVSLFVYEKKTFHVVVDWKDCWKC